MGKVRELVSVAYFGADENTFTEVQRLAELAGVKVERATVSRRVRGVLNFSQDPQVEHGVIAYFDPDFVPYFRSGRVPLDVKRDTAEVLELLVAVGATVRGKVVGVVGAQGGVGSTTLSIWLARELANLGRSVALIDMCPESAGLDMYYSGVDTPGNRWADLTGQGELLSGRLNDSLPEWKKVRVLSADDRGGVPSGAELGVKAISALSQVNQFTVLDLPQSCKAATSPEHSWLAWCDVVLMLCRTDELGIVQGQLAFDALRKENSVHVVAFGKGSKGMLAHIATRLGVPEVHPFRHQRGITNDLARGLAPGDRAKTRCASDVRALVKRIVEIEA